MVMVDLACTASCPFACFSTSCADAVSPEQRIRAELYISCASDSVVHSLGFRHIALVEAQDQPQVAA